MSKTARDVPPPLELLCLNALWSLKEGNVGDVRRIVSATRPLAYTTIMTVLDRLVRKGRLTRRKQPGHAIVYVPQSSRDAMRRTAIRELVDDFFDGSQEELLRFLQPEPNAVAVAAGGGETAPAASQSGGIDAVLL